MLKKENVNSVIRSNMSLGLIALSLFVPLFILFDKHVSALMLLTIVIIFTIISMDNRIYFLERAYNENKKKKVKRK